MGCTTSKPRRAVYKHGDLLKPQAPKRRGGRSAANDVAAPGSPGFAGDDFAGLFKVTVDCAKMKRKGHYNVTLSMGLQVRNCAQH